MKTLLSYSPAIGKETSITVEFQAIGEYKNLPVDSEERWAKAKIVKIIDEPTPTHTGSAIYRVEYSNGNHHEDIGIILKQRGGARPGAGRPSKGERVLVNFRISKEAHDKLKQHSNMSEWIEQLIINA